MKKRILISTTTGAILGIFCIIGASIRLGFNGNEIFIFSTWINRVLMGFVIGLAPYLKITNKNSHTIIRGLFFGLIISGSFYISTEFKDFTGFIAGLFYGVIIDYIATKYKKSPKK